MPGLHTVCRGINTSTSQHHIEKLYEYSSTYLFELLLETPRRLVDWRRRLLLARMPRRDRSAALGVRWRRTLETGRTSAEGLWRRILLSLERLAVWRWYPRAGQRLERSTGLH